MRHQKTPRVLSAILACAMLTTLLPMGALATDTTTDETTNKWSLTPVGLTSDKTNPTYELTGDITVRLFPNEDGTAAALLASDDINASSSALSEALKKVAQEKLGTLSAQDTKYPTDYEVREDVVTATWTVDTSSLEKWKATGGEYTLNVEYKLGTLTDEAAKGVTYELSKDTTPITVKVAPVTVDSVTGQNAEGATVTLEPMTESQIQMATVGSLLPSKFAVTYNPAVDKNNSYAVASWQIKGETSNTELTDDALKALTVGTYTLVPVFAKNVIPAWATVPEGKFDLTLTVEKDKPGKTDLNTLDAPTLLLNGQPVTAGTKAKVGDTLTASLKDSEGKEITGLTWSWTPVKGTSGVDPTVTGNSYKIPSDAFGKTIKVTAKANDDNLTYMGTSNEASIVVATNDEPTKLDGLKPVIKGTPKLDEVLTATLSGVEKGEPDIAWSWTAGGQPVNGNGDTLKVTGAMSNLEIKVQAKAVDTSTKYSGTTAESDAVKVEMMAINGNVAYSITDAQGQAATKVAVDYIITADVSNIAPVEAQDGLSYQWIVGGVKKAGATGKSYTVDAADDKKEIYVTATAGENFSGEVTSKEHLVVGKSLLTGTLTIAPTTDIKEGTKLTATLTPAAPENACDIFWFRGSEQIGTGAEYTVTKADLGQTLTVTAVGKGDYTGGLNAEVKIPAYAPEAPVATASAGNGAITLSWNTPADNGRAISGYTVYLHSKTNSTAAADDQEYNVDNTTHSYTFTGLTNGTVYTVYVVAHNAIGSTPSQELEATPYYNGGNGGGGGGGGTSGGGGGNSSSGTTDKNVNTSGDTTTVTVNVKPTVSGDTASATLSDTTVNNAIDKAVKAASDEGTDAVLEINVSSGTSVDEVRATLSADAFKDIANSDIAAVTISSDLGYLELDRDAIEAIAKQLGSGNVTLSLGKVDTSKELNERQQTVVGDAPVFDISIKSGSNVISNIGGELTVTLPYTLKSGEKADGVEVRYLDDNGNLESMPTTYNSRTGLVTFTTTHLSLYAIAYDEAASWENPFNDVRQSDWYFDAVRYASMNGLFNGTSASMFSPNASMTRSMLVTVLWRYAGEPAASGSSFSDVPAGQWYTTAVAWASANGIVSGIGEGKFAPNANVTREQIASILYRYAQSAGIVVSDSVGSGTFADQSSVSSWAVSGMNWAVKAGIISGRDGNRLAPSATASRAEVATMLQRFAVAAK